MISVRLLTIDIPRFRSFCCHIPYCFHNDNISSLKILVSTLILINIFLYYHGYLQVEMAEESSSSSTFLCPFEGKAMKKSSKYRHNKAHLKNEIAFQCSMCSKYFRTKYDLQKHIEYGSHTENVFHCEKCDKQFSRRENLKRHVEQVHEKRTYCCAICGVGLSSSLKVKLHYIKCKLFPENNMF